MSKILHVTECYAGGVSRAIVSRVRATPEHQHALVWDGGEPPAGSEGFNAVYSFPRGFVSRLRFLKRVIAIEKPDFVHAHSSWAGVYSRLLPFSVPVVYEPHCFKFEDPSLGAAKRSFYFTAESILARRTRAFGVLTPHEAKLAASLRRGVRSVAIPNVPSLVPPYTTGKSRDRSRVTMVGRICSQKDPTYFLQVVRELKGLGSSLLPTWIGDGDARFRNELVANGVEVTGWLGGQEVAAVLDESVYLHTASYEGFPLSVLDAAGSGSPIVARRIPAFYGYTFAMADSPKDIALLAVEFSKAGTAQKESFVVNSRLLASNSLESLNSSLNLLYS